MDVLTIITNHGQTIHIIAHLGTEEKKKIQDCACGPSHMPIEVRARIDEIRITTVKGGMFILKPQ